MQEAACLQPGTVLAGKYKVQKLIAASELSLVYQVVLQPEGGNGDPSSSNLRIVKEFYPRSLVLRDMDRQTVLCRASSLGSKFDTLLEAFRQETRLHQNMEHPHIARQTDNFQQNKTAYLVTEYCAGLTLENYMKEVKVQNYAALYSNTLLPLLDALSHVHRQGVLHRDLKPGNIIITPDGSPKLLDFGAAIPIGEKSSKQVFTSAGYSPLEFYSDKSRQSVRSDLFSFAAVLYFCCCGRPPEDVKERIISDRIPHLRSLSKEVSPFLAALIMWGLAIPYNRRCPSLEWFRFGLKAEKLWRSLRRHA